MAGAIPRSVPMGAVVAEARRLVEKGFAEIVLTGVDLTSYGADLPGTPHRWEPWWKNCSNWCRS